MPLPDELFRQLHEMKYSNHPIEFDKDGTAQNLKRLRLTNADFARYICKFSRLYKLHNTPKDLIPNDIPCPHDPPYFCENCYEFHKRENGDNDISTRIISKEKELTNWREDQISAMENGRDLTIEKVFFYAYLAKVPLSEVLVLKNGYTFDSNGIIVRINNEINH